MLIFLHGADTYRSRERLRQLIAAFREKHDPQGYNLTRIDCTSVEPGVVLEAILAAPFLASKRMVVLERLFEAGNTELEDLLMERVNSNPSPSKERAGGGVRPKSIPDDVILVVWTGPPSAARKSAAADKKKPSALYPRLAKEEHAQEYKTLSGAELKRWIAGYTKTRGSSLAADALTVLIEAAGSDLWQVTAILDPAFAYAQGRAVTAEDIAKFAETPLDENAFHFTDALAGKNTKSALALLQAQWGLGEAPEKLIGLLAWQWRTLLLARDFLDRQSTPSPLEGEGRPARRDAGATEPERSGGMRGAGKGGGEGATMRSPLPAGEGEPARHASQLAGVAGGGEGQSQPANFAQSSGLNPFVAGKALRAAGKWSRSALESHYETLLSIDHSLKTGGEDPKLQLERFVFEVTGE